MTRAAVGLPGVAREDWTIIRAASEFLGKTLPYDSLPQLRYRMEEISPALTRYDLVESVSVEVGKMGEKVGLVEMNKGEAGKAKGKGLETVVKNFYFTDAISRSSPTMGRCSAAKMGVRGIEANPDGGEAAYAAAA